MSIRNYLGLQIAKPYTATLLVGSSTVGHTFIVTVGGTKAVKYVAVTGDTVNTIAAAIQALLTGSSQGEFKENDWAIDGTTAAQIDMTGPADGAPVTIAVSGTGTFTLATVAGTSPSDLADHANYDTFPIAADTLNFGDNAASPKYNLGALSGIALAAVNRYKTHTGTWGLPEVNVAGNYPEYRAKRMSLNTLAVNIETNGQEAAGQLRVLMAAAAGEAITITGVPGSGGNGVGVVDLDGVHSSSSLFASNTSVVISALPGESSSLASMGLEASVALLGANCAGAPATVLDAGSQLTARASLGATTVYNGSSITMELAATVASFHLYRGSSIVWNSSGAVPAAALVVSNDCAFDLSQIYGAFASANAAATLTLYKGSTLLDPFGRLGNLAWTFVECGFEDCTVQLGVGRRFTPG